MTTSTPEQKREAWLALASHLDTTLVATREHARASRKMAEVIMEDTGYCPGVPPEEWDATAWAADQLLRAVQGLSAPEVPVDHARGREAIPFPTERDIQVSLGLRPTGTLPSSTPGDNPGDGLDPESRSR